MYIYINSNKEKSLLNELDTEIEKLKKLDLKLELENTKKYWQKYVKEHDKLGINKKNIDFNIVKNYLPLFPDKIYKNLYNGGLMNELV